jgi:Protein of unknown function (DUF4242)
MPVYLVDRAVHGATMERLEMLRKRTEEACRVVAMQGKHIRYLRSMFAPGDSRCECLFEAASSELVREVNDASGFAYERIVLAIDLGPVGITEHMESTQYAGERN